MSEGIGSRTGFSSLMAVLPSGDAFAEEAWQILVHAGHKPAGRLRQRAVSAPLSIHILIETQLLPTATGIGSFAFWAMDR